MFDCSDRWSPAFSSPSVPLCSRCGRSLGATLCAVLMTGVGLFAGVSGASAAGADGAVMPLGQTTFAAYAEDARHWVAAHRPFLTADRAFELSANLPKEYRPAKPDGRGVLLVHGLGDSPWTFSDLAQSLADRGLLVRTVLLPGCGTRPHDMMAATADDWRRVVDEQATILSGEVSQMWLGGYSTGGNLVIDWAAKHPDKTAGLLLFSPAVEVRPALAWAAGAASKVIDWLVKPESRPNGGRNPFQYFVVPVKGFAAFYSTMTAADDALSRFEKTPYTGRSAVMLAAHDGLVKTEALLTRFDRAFSNPATRILWYGNAKAANGLSERVTVLPETVPEMQVTSFSHMSLTYRPDNPFYGLGGAERLCWNGQKKAASLRCEKGEPVWYSGEKHQPDPGKNHARLTFNPWYDRQLEVILDVIGRR